MAMVVGPAGGKTTLTALCVNLVYDYLFLFLFKCKYFYAELLLAPDSWENHPISNEKRSPKAKTHDRPLFCVDARSIPRILHILAILYSKNMDSCLDNTQNKCCFLLDTLGMPSTAGHYIPQPQSPPFSATFFSSISTRQKHPNP